MFAIVISEKGGAERREAFQKEEITIGRVQANDLTLPKGNVSKHHARIAELEGRFVVTDQNSTNGTYVNRRRITQPTIVREGDRIYVGDFILRIESEAAGQEGDDEPNTESRGLPVPEPGNDSVSVSSREIEIHAADGPAMTLPPESPFVEDSEPQDASGLARIDVQQVLVELVRSVVERLEPGAWEAESSTGTRVRVERLLREQLMGLKRQGVIPRGISAETLEAAALAELTDIGPLRPLLDDPTVTRILVNGHKSITVYRGEQHAPVTPCFSTAASLDRTLGRLCRIAGRNLGRSATRVSRELPSGFTFDAVREPDSRTTLLLNLVRRVPATTTLDDLVRRGTISRAIATLLERCAQGRANLLVVGGADSAFADVLSALFTAASKDTWLVLADRHDFARDRSSVSQVLTAELGEPQTLPFAARIAEARLLVENLSGAWFAAALDAMGQGALGLTAASRATTVRQSLSRLTTDLVAARPGLSAVDAHQAVATTFDLVVELSRLPDGRDRVLRVLELSVAGSGTLEEADIFAFTIERTATGGAIEGSFSATGRVPRVAEDLARRGIAVESALFQR